MAPSYKVKYFDFTGRAEPIRFIFHYAGVQFEDVRLAKEEFQKIKPTLPFGQLPVLEIDGVTYNQSLDICRYLGKQFGLAGQNDLENLKIDGMVGNLEDLGKKAGDITFNSDEAKKAELKEKLTNETLPFVLSKLEESVQKNGGYLVGNKATWADIIFLTIYDVIRNTTEGNVFAKYPGLIKLKDTILANPGIRNYLKNSTPPAMFKFQLKSEL